MQNQSANTECILTVNGLALTIGNQSILRQLSFAVSRGQFVGLLGPNGAGKSSLLRCLYRFLSPSTGDITFLGRTISTYSKKEYAQQVAVVLQELPEQFNLSLWDVVAMGVTPHKSLFSTIDNDDKHNIQLAIEQVGLADKAQRQFSQLSGGEKQRALIAKAIVQKPKLLIMDEPTSHLDVKYQIQIMELAKSLGVTVIASFHDLNLASAICDELLVIQGGELVKKGSPMDVINAELLSDVFGVCAEVTHVPCPYGKDRQTPHIRYHFGYQQ